MASYGDWASFCSEKARLHKYCQCKVTKLSFLSMNCLIYRSNIYELNFAVWGQVWRGERADTEKTHERTARTVRKIQVKGGKSENKKIQTGRGH